MTQTEPVSVVVLTPESPFVEGLCAFLGTCSPSFRITALTTASIRHHLEIADDADLVLCDRVFFDKREHERLFLCPDGRPPVIVLGESDCTRSAVAAIKAGASDYWHKDESAFDRLAEIMWQNIEESVQTPARHTNRKTAGTSLPLLLMRVFQAIPGMLTVQNRDRQVLLSNFVAVPSPDGEEDRPLRCHQVFGCGEGACQNCPMHTVFETGRAIRMEQNHPETGRTHEINIFPIKDASGAVILTGEYRRDISHQREMAKELLDSEEKYLALAENSSDIICRLDRSTRVLYVNAAIHRLLGIEPDAAQGRRAVDLSAVTTFFSGFAPYVEEVFSSGKSRAFGAFHQRKGETVEFDCRLSPEFDRDGSVMSVIASARDMSDLRRTLSQKKQLESQLAQVQKMESMGRLAGGVAHDFNNFLTGVTGNISLALITHQHDLELVAIMQEILRGAERAAGLTHQLLAFSRKQRAESSPTNLSDAVENLLKMLGRIIGEDICLSLKLEPSLPPIMANVGQIEQVIVNLVVNARDAMPNGGNLQIVTELGAAPTLWTERSGYARSQAVCLHITDTGIGMNEETQRLIFEPFFTTKPQGMGTGLGLSTVYGIVTQHHAHIECTSAPGDGTTFSIYFPIEEQPLTTPPEPRPLLAIPGGTETILLVEDDQTVREVSTKILGSAGYDVIAARSAEEALARFEKMGDSVDLVVTDVIMPNMNGRELADGLLKRRPDLRILFVSGYTHDVVVTRGVGAENQMEFLSKPFSPQQLAAKVREMLDQGELE